MRIGITPASIGVTAEWWLEAARAAEQAGFDSVWSVDHFVSRGRLTDPVLECWTMLAAATRETTRIRLGSFVTNVMNRHPAVLARMAATVGELSKGRLDLGIGAGGQPAEHVAYGIPFPELPDRGQHLEEAVAVLRLLFTGGPVDHVSDLYPLHGAHAYPAPDPVPRIVVAAGSPLGARRAARIGDAMTCRAEDHERLRPVFQRALAEAGREPATVPVIVEVAVAGAMDDLDGLAGDWAERGVAELVIGWVRPAQLSPLLEAAERSATLGRADPG